MTTTGKVLLFGGGAVILIGIICVVGIAAWLVTAGVRMTKEEPRLTVSVSAGQTGFPSGGAEGIRTPDLLIANETRYQLRHSPSMRTKL